MEHSVCTQEVDRLSILPDDWLLQILSFFPTKLAAQTSVLSHRFRYLWESSPSIDLDLHTFQNTNLVEFYQLANRILLNRNPPCPLRCLHLCLDRFDGHSILPVYISSLVTKASTLGLRHLTIQMYSTYLTPLLPLIFSLHQLESLSLSYIFLEPISIPFPITLTHLKRLHLKIDHILSASLTQLIGSLTMLEELNLQSRYCLPDINLTSMTIRRLKISSSSSCVLGISIPSLEFLQLEIRCPGHLRWLEVPIFKNCFQWDMPALKKAIIQLRHVSKENVHGIFGMLQSIAHVEELHLDIQDSLVQTYPFDALGFLGVCPPTFFNLRHIDLNISCHKHNITTLVSLVQHSPVLESLDVVHKAFYFLFLLLIKVMIPPYDMRTSDPLDCMYTSKIGNICLSYFELILTDSRNLIPTY